jgi:hypothetical protein
MMVIQGLVMGMCRLGTGVTGPRQYIRGHGPAVTDHTFEMAANPGQSTSQ